MQLVVVSNDLLKKEWLAQAQNTAVSTTWVTDIRDLGTQAQADVYVDLLFENQPERVQLLKSVNKPVIINSVEATVAETDPSFIRINGWPGFLQTALVEASSSNTAAKPLAEQLFQQLGKQVCWLPDQPGFVTPRVVSAIINEAFFSLQEGVSTREAIDAAMKLGTNYPYGPFEWAALIGLKKVNSLLLRLSQVQSRYQPAALLQQEAGQ